VERREQAENPPADEDEEDFGEFVDDFDEEQHNKTLRAMGIKVRDFVNEKPGPATSPLPKAGPVASSSSSQPPAASTSKATTSTPTPTTSADVPGRQRPIPRGSTYPLGSEHDYSGPAYEIYNPTEGLGTVEYFLRQYPRRRPVPGKDTFRLLQLGWITREEVMDRYKLRDLRAWQEYCDHVETHGEHPWRRLPWEYPRREEGNFPDSFRAHCLHRTMTRLSHLEALWNETEGGPSPLEEEFERYREEEWTRVENAWVMRRLQEDRVERGHSPFGYEEDGDPSFGVPKRKRGNSDDDDDAPRVKRTKGTKLPPASEETTPDLYMNLERWWLTHPDMRPSTWVPREL